MLNLNELKDPEKANCLYEQISEFGQTPFQMFKNSSHPEKKITKSQKRLHEIAAKIECTIVFKNPTPIIYFYQSEEDHFKIILKNNDVVEYQTFETKERQSISHFCFNINIEDSPMKPLNYNQIYVLKKNPNILIVGGYPDNSFKIHNNQKEKASCYFHRKIITCLDFSEANGLIACGSKDFRISLWVFDIKNSNLLSFHPVFVFYGHQNEVIALCIEDDLEILGSVDKNNICLLHSLKSRKYLNKIDLKLDNTDEIKFIKIHPNGLILFCSKKNTLMLYKYVFSFCFFIKFCKLVLMEKF